jgi:hypothetical protein
MYVERHWHPTSHSNSNKKNKNAVGVGVGDVKGERITTMAALQGKEASNVMYL